MDDKIPLYALDLSRENQNKNTRAMPNYQYWVLKAHIQPKYIAPRARQILISCDTKLSKNF